MKICNLKYCVQAVLTVNMQVYFLLITKSQLLFTQLSTKYEDGVEPLQQLTSLYGNKRSYRRILWLRSNGYTELLSELKYQLIPPPVLSANAHSASPQQRYIRLEPSKVFNCVLKSRVFTLHHLTNGVAQNTSLKRVDATEAVMDPPIETWIALRELVLNAIRWPYHRRSNLSGWPSSFHYVNG